MSIWFVIVTVLFMLVALAMVLIILVQRPQGGGLAGAFGGAGGSSTDTVFGGRVGDALTIATVVVFALYLLLAIGLNLLDNVGPGGVPATPAAVQAGPVPDTGTGAGLGDTLAPDLGATFPTAVPETPPPDDAVPIIDPSDSDQSNDDPGER